MGRRHKSKPGDLPNALYNSMLRVESSEWIRLYSYFRSTFYSYYLTLKHEKESKKFDHFISNVSIQSIQRVITFNYSQTEFLSQKKRNRSD